ncbi:hypothetical protein CAL12_27205 [Bordetella genomosp. 8]|uniref:HTH marR-type domain-containing protein n=1 Tax=Bordetella genomosp. 8 TaxID=1416806 RepID=A0A1W6YTA5_9BORD|nr:MarR family winged helix-turn-helix transcriptional regulator [Bordetella genomosp. 8]ARP84139.1 hypothetical protein CAL12_27205 [Bordetella genomosp. 8]
MDPLPRKRPPSPCNCGALRKAARRISRLYDEALAPVGIGAGQHAILAELARWADDAPTLWELADALVLDRTTIGRNLRPLERDGYVDIRPCAIDRRKKRVGLTPAGRRKLAESAIHWQQAQDAFERSFGPAQARSLRSRLLAIANTQDIDINDSGTMQPMVQTPYLKEHDE